MLKGSTFGFALWTARKSELDRASRHGVAVQDVKVTSREICRWEAVKGRIPEHSNANVQVLIVSD